MQLLNSEASTLERPATRCLTWGEPLGDEVAWLLPNSPSSTKLSLATVLYLRAQREQQS